MKSKIFEKERNVSQKYILKGGTDAIFEVKDNLASGQPCVVVEVSLQGEDKNTNTKQQKTRKNKKHRSVNTEHYQVFVEAD